MPLLENKVESYVKSLEMLVDIINAALLENALGSR